LRQIVTHYTHRRTETLAVMIPRFSVPIVHVYCISASLSLFQWRNSTL